MDRQMGSAALLEVTHCQECHYQCIKDSLNRQCETLCLSRCIYIHSHRDINTCHHLGLYVTHAHVNPSTKGQWHTHIHTHIHTHTHTYIAHQRKKTSAKHKLEKRLGTPKYSTHCRRDQCVPQQSPSYIYIFWSRCCMWRARLCSLKMLHKLLSLCLGLVLHNNINTTTTTTSTTTTTTTAPPPSPPPPPAITTTTVSRGVSPEHGYSKCCSYHRPMLGPWLLQIQDVRTIGPRRQLCDLWVAPLPPPRLPLVSRLEMIDGMTVTKWAALLHLALVYTMEISYSSVLLAGSTLVCILDERKTEREKEREKERGRGRDRETERQRQTDRQTETEGETERQRDRDRQRLLPKFK